MSDETDNWRTTFTEAIYGHAAKGRLFETSHPDGEHVPGRRTWPEITTHTIDDCMAAVGAHVHAIEIRLRLAEAILAADGIPLVDSMSAFIERVGHAVAGIALIVETGVPWTEPDAAEDATEAAK